MKGQTHGGKGSAQRPTDTKKFNDNWDRIFNKAPEKKEGADVTSKDDRPK